MIVRVLRLAAVGAVLAFPQQPPDASRVCAGCHKEIWESYRHTGMGRSFSLPAAENIPMPAGAFYHDPSESFFSIIRRGNEYFQKRHQLDSNGREINALEKRIDYVLGSGNHARTYLHRTPANTLIELPLGWYAENGGLWAMNPGYDRPDHDGFRRPVNYDCMFCHNAYPRIAAKSEKYGAVSVYPAAMPEGIDCTRCHGAGTQHATLAGRPGATPEQIRKAIVNPARLNGDRQMEICMACHLETTSFPLPNALQRFERGPFSFRPGEPLANFLLNFDHAPDAGRGEKFEIVSSVYRLRRSACFTRSAGRMQCVTCHNPHNAPRGDAATQHYNKVCGSCHRGETLSEAAHQEPSRNCVACHMPKRRTEDVVHALATDHAIPRRPPPARVLLAARAERRDSYRGGVVPYYPAKLESADELYRAAAQVRDKSNLKAGITQLTAAIAKHAPKRGEWYLELGDALENDGQSAKALERYREAAARDPASEIAWQKLGTSLRKASRGAEAVTALQRSLALAPERALTWHELGLTYQALGRTAEALQAMTKAIGRDPEMPEAHNNFGILRASTGDVAWAEVAFREAIRIKPNYADARFNFAMLLGKSERYDEAQQELEAALRGNPAFADAHELLGDLLLGRRRPGEAVPHFREAVRLRPASMRAAFGLGVALVSTGDRGGGIESLRKAAAGPDAEIRKRAADLLQALQ